MTLHSQKNRSSEYYLITLFNKKTFMKEKMIEINQYCSENIEIVGVKCNYRKIVVFTTTQLLVFDNEFDE